MVIDRSGSMASRDVTPDNSAIRNSVHFAGLDNVLGVVYEAAYKYLCERSARAPNDLMTFVPFDNYAQVAFASQPITSADALLASMMQWKPSGGTQFSSALDTAHASVQAVRTSDHELPRSHSACILHHLFGQADLA